MQQRAAARRLGAQILALAIATALMGCSFAMQTNPTGWEPRQQPTCSDSPLAPIVDTSAANITVSKGLGARHWAGAAISKKTKAVAVVVSQSTGTVRVFENGEVMLRIEPLRHAMKWKEFEYEPPTLEAE